MYLYEEQYYLISNHAVARNTIFSDVCIQLHFRNKMKLYLEPLCDILAFNLNNHEFQILVRLKERDVFHDYFQSNLDSIGQIITPESTYIFSQAMSNLQNSLVKKFNYKYNRKGTLMAGRFKRELISSKDRVVEIIQELNAGKQGMNFSGIWAECAMKRMKPLTSKGLYKSIEMGAEEDRVVFWTDHKNHLVDSFDSPCFNTQYFKFYFLQRRLFNSICKHFS